MSNLAPAPAPITVPGQIDAHEFAHALHELLESNPGLHTYECYDPDDLDAFAAGTISGERL